MNSGHALGDTVRFYSEVLQDTLSKLGTGKKLNGVEIYT
jgi:hypothetical protein